jgi:hypothetical protein
MQVKGEDQGKEGRGSGSSKVEREVKEEEEEEDKDEDQEDEDDGGSVFLFLMAGTYQGIIRTLCRALPVERVFLGILWS